MQNSRVIEHVMPYVKFDINVKLVLIIHQLIIIYFIFDQP